MKTSFITLPFPGVSRIGVEGEGLGLWDLVVLGSDRVRLPASDAFILGAWDPSYENLITALCEMGTVVVCWTSSIGEMSFEPIEQNYLERILGDDGLSTWFGNPSLARLYPTKGFYAPYPIKIEMRPVAEKEDIVTLFCPTALKKNLLNQICAIALLQREVDLTLHTNVPIDPNFAKSIGLKHVQHGWLERATYLELLSKARLNFAVSWAETFSYQVADSVMAGTPSVVSTTISWIQEGWTQDRVVPNPNSPVEIAGMAEMMLDRLEDHLSTQRSDLEQFASRSAEVVDKLSMVLTKL